MTDFKNADRWPWPEDAAHQLWQILVRGKHMTDFKNADRWPWPEDAAHQLIIRAKGQWQTIASIVHEIARLRARLAKLERDLGATDETD